MGIKKAKQIMLLLLIGGEANVIKRVKMRSDSFISETCSNYWVLWCILGTHVVPGVYRWECYRIAGCSALVLQSSGYHENTPVGGSS